MKTDVSASLRALDDLARRAIGGAESGLAQAAPAVAAQLRATDAHGDDTGATRAGYTAFVVGPTLDGSDALARSMADVDAFHPGRAMAPAIGDVADAVRAILTSPTDYQQILMDVRGGQMDALTPTLAAQTPALHQAACDGIKRAVGS